MVRLKRFERSEAVERLERLERADPMMNGATRWNVWNGLIPDDERSEVIERLERLDFTPWSQEASQL